MDHQMLGDDSRDERPKAPNNALANQLEDSEDRGRDVDDWVDVVDDSTGTIDSDDDHQPSASASAPAAPGGAQPTAKTVGTGEPAEKKGPPPMFDSLEEWVHGWLLPLYPRSLDGSAVTFCREWWRHPEAYLRLDALWKSWEFMRRKTGTGMAVWLRDYCDYHMGVLMRENGTFKGCKLEAHNHEFAVKPWVVAPMPTPRQIARLYDRLGVQHARPEDGSQSESSATALRSVQTRPWDGVDQK
jgi:hypothetical protein